MPLHYDEKGKFYTDYVSKRALEAVIQTTTHLIQGFIYVRPNERVSDEMNSSDQFLAITDAEIFSLSGEKLYTCEFLTLNRDAVIWLMPREQKEEEEKKEE